MQTEHATTSDTGSLATGPSRRSDALNRSDALACTILASICLGGDAGILLWLVHAQTATGAATAVLLLALHAGCAACGGAACLFLVPYSARRPYARLWLLSFLLCLATPLLGVMIFLSAQVGYKYRPKHVIAPLLVVGEPAYSVQRASAQQRRKGSARVNVLDNTLSAADRINAQLALQDAPGKISADLLRSLLTDPIEDIRLLAYGLLDGKEKKISQRILIEQENLRAAQEPQETYAAHRRLCELNWELIYQRMVQGDMRKFSGAQSIKHARAALKIKPDDGGLWFLCARVNLALNRPDEAATDLANAEKLGIPLVQLLPYFAEMAFEKRDLRMVQETLQRLTEKPSSKGLGAVYEYWTGRA